MLAVQVYGVFGYVRVKEVFERVHGERLWACQSECKNRKSVIAIDRSTIRSEVRGRRVGEKTSR